MLVSSWRSAAVAMGPILPIAAAFRCYLTESNNLSRGGARAMTLGGANLAHEGVDGLVEGERLLVELRGGLQHLFRGDAGALGVEPHVPDVARDRLGARCRLPGADGDLLGGVGLGLGDVRDDGSGLADVRYRPVHGGDGPHGRHGGAADGVDIGG